MAGRWWRLRAVVGGTTLSEPRGFAANGPGAVHNVNAIEVPRQGPGEPAPDRTGPGRQGAQIQGQRGLPWAGRMRGPRNGRPTHLQRGEPRGSVTPWSTGIDRLRQVAVRYVATIHIAAINEWLRPHLHRSVVGDARPARRRAGQRASAWPRK